MLHSVVPTIAAAVPDSQWVLAIEEIRGVGIEPTIAGYKPGATKPHHLGRIYFIVM